MDMQMEGTHQEGNLEHMGVEVGHKVHMPVVVDSPPVGELADQYVTFVASEALP